MNAQQPAQNAPRQGNTAGLMGYHKDRCAKIRVELESLGKQPQTDATRAKRAELINEYNKSKAVYDGMARQQAQSQSWGHRIFVQPFQRMGRAVRGHSRRQGQ